MKVTISRDDLVRVLRLAQGIAPRKHDLPILSSVLLRANGSTLQISATDLTVSMTGDIPCRATSHGAIVLNAHDFGKFLSSTTDEDVSISVDDSARAEIRCGKSRYRMVGMRDRDFPKIFASSVTGMETDATMLHDALSTVKYAVSPDDTREALRGVMISSDGSRCSFLASDGHRGVRVSREVAFPETQKIISVCAPGVDAIIRMTSSQVTCRVSIERNAMMVVVDGMAVRAPLLDFVAPDLNVLIASVGAPTATVTADRYRLIAAIKQTSPLNGETHGTRLRSTPSGISISSSDRDGEEIETEIECDSVGEVYIEAMAKYLIDALSAMAGDTCVLKFLGELDPIIIADHDAPGYTAIVMPMRM